MTKRGKEPDRKLARKIVRFLNGLIAMDKEAVTRLVELRAECNGILSAHPTVQVSTSNRPSGVPEVGMLGVLNGLCGTIQHGKRKGWGLITACGPDAPEKWVIDRFAITDSKRERKARTRQ